MPAIELPANDATVTVVFGGQPINLTLGENTIAAQQAAQQAADSAVDAAASVIDSSGFASAAQNSANIAQGAVNELLTGLPPQAAVGPSAYFGIESADRLADAPGRGIQPPLNAFLLPDADNDWFAVIYCSTGQELKTGQFEMLASKGNGFAAASSSNCALGIYERGVTSPAGVAWKFQATLNNINRDLFAGMSPSLNTQERVKFGKYCIVLGVVNRIPHFAYSQVSGDNPYRFRASAQSTQNFGSFHFGTALTATSISRTGGVATVLQNSFSSTYVNGTVTLVKCAADPSFDGIYRITRLAGNTGFTFVNAGPDIGTTASPQYVLQRARTEIFKMLGRYETAVAGDAVAWAGGISGAEMRYGTMPISGGLVDLNWLAKLANRQIPRDELPGMLQWGCNMDPTNLAPIAGSTIALNAIAIGGVRSWQNSESSFLSVDNAEPDKIYAADFYTGLGTVLQGFAYSGAIITLIGSIRDAIGVVIMPDQIVADGDDMVQGRGVLTMTNVPTGRDYYLHGYASNNPNFAFVYGPFSVGPIGAMVQQSTMEGQFSTASSGGTLAPNDGVSVVGISGEVTNVGTNFTDQAEFSRVIHRNLLFAGQSGNGIIACNNKITELLTAQNERPAAASFGNLCRSGHPADIYWADRRRFINLCGTALPGVALTGVWRPHPMFSTLAPIWAKLGSVQLYKGGALVLSNPFDPLSDYVLTGGQLIAELSAGGQWVGGVSGTFNITTASGNNNFSITDAVGGVFYISAEMEFDTPPGSTSIRGPSDGFTAFGHDDILDSGHISNMLRDVERYSFIHYSWGNYLLSYASGASQADVTSKVAFDAGMIRRRFEKYESAKGLPWVIAADPRTKSGTSLAEHRIRVALREYAKSTSNTHYAVGCIGAEMDAINSPHSSVNPLGGRFVGLTNAHGILAAMNVAGANGEEVFPISAVRMAANIIEVTFNVPAGAALANGGGDPDSNWVGATPDTMLLLDLPNHETVFVGTDKIRITKTNGNFSAVAYYNYGYGVAIIDTTLAAENARLPNMLFLNNGGYDDVVPGTPVQAAPSSLLVT